MPLRRYFLTFVLGGCFLAASFAVQSAEPLHPWLVHAPRFVKESHFVNLKDGDVIETPFLVKFGLTGHGLAAIDRPIPKTGHHHLLVNRGLPIDFSQPLPFNEQYIHFGKGAMEAILNYPPGEYTLQLLLADEKHIPNFISSRQIKIRVTQQNKDVDPKSLIVTGVDILAPRSDELVRRPFRILAHASGLNISHLSLGKKDTGHFRIKIRREDGPEETISLSNGYTEAWLNPPKTGVYAAYVEFVDNSAPNRILFKSGIRRFAVLK